MSIIKRVCAQFDCARNSSKTAATRWAAFVRMVLVGLCICPALTATAGVNSFTTLGPEGGRINKVVFHPENASIAFAAAASGFYRSTDGGEQWQLVSDAFVNEPTDIAFDPDDLDHLFVGSNGGLYSSTDGGLTLSEVSTFAEPGNMSGEIEMGSDGTLYVASLGRVLRSTDGGVSWSSGEPAAQASNESLNFIRVHPSNPQTIYAIVDFMDVFGSVVRRSADGGATWDATAIALPAAETYVNDLQLVEEGMWLATNTGTWWIEEGGAWDHRTAMNTPITRLEIDPANSSIVYAAHHSAGLYKSVDEGGNWAPVQGDARTGNITTIAIARSEPETLLVGGFEGVIGSLDAGDTWTARNGGILGTEVNSIVAAAASDRIYIGTSYNGVHFVEGEALDVAPVDNEELRDLATIPFLATMRALYVAAQSPDELLVALGADKVARSSDGGASWNEHGAFDFVQTGGVSFVSSAIVDEERFDLVGTEKALFRSADSGATWPQVSLDDYKEFGPANATSASNPAIVFMAARTTSDTNTVLKSEDGGETWAPTSWPANAAALAIAIDPTDERVLYVASNQGLSKSTDGGATWASLAWSTVPQGTFAVAIDPQNTNIVYAPEPNNIRRSVNGGQTWESLPIAQAPAYWDVRSLAVDPVRPYRLFAGAQQGGVREISIQPDLVLEASGPVVDGSAHEFVLEATNDGPFDATNVRTTITLSGGATAVEANATGGSCTSTANVVTCTRPILRVGESSDVSVRITYSDDGNPSVAATLEGEQLDLDSTNNFVQLVGEFVEVSDLSVALSGPTTLTAGSAATYTITASNDGPTGATNAEVRFTSTLAAATAVPSSGSCTIVSGAVECVIPSLGARESVSIAITTVPSTAGTHQGTSTIAASGIDPTDSNDSATVTTNVAAPQPSNPPKSGGGGGGSSSLLLLGLIAALGVFRRERMTYPAS